MPHAFAKVTVKVQCKSNWSPETTADQIFRQASDDALVQLRYAFKDRSDMAIVGEPEITMVHTNLNEAK